MLDQKLHLFKALSNRGRLQVIEALMGGPLTVNQLVDITGLGQSRVSQALACLANCGFVEATRHGRHRLYHLNGTTRPLLRAAWAHYKTYKRRLETCAYLADAHG